MSPRSRVGDALRQLGMDDDATRVYEVLLERAPVPLEQIESASGLDHGTFEEVYTRLVDAGLAGAAGPETVVSPLPPSPTLEVLGRHRAAEIEKSRMVVTSAFETFRRERYAVGGGDVVEIVTGPDIGPRLRQVWRSAAERIRQIDSPPYFQIDGGVEDALETLARGVRHRMVYARESLTFPGKLADDIEKCIEAGEEARVVPSAPVKMILVDDRLAVVAPSIGEADVYNTMLVVQPSPLFSACAALFESVWNTGLPFHDRFIDTPRLMPQDRLLFSLLASGLTDDAIAQELDISRRTLYRRLEVHGARLGAATRFQLALQAQRRGWI